MRIARRTMLAGGLAVAGGALLPAGLAAAAETAPVRTITRGPKFHWFGYYDKLEFDPTDRYVLSNEVEFEHRSPTGEDSIRIGMVDTEEDNRWIDLGGSRAFGWQQGCMLQWLPQSDRQVVWNDREGDRFVSRVLDIRGSEQRTLPRPIYALSPDGKTAITADFARIQDMRPGYGYAGASDPYGDERAPADSGVWRMDMRSGQSELILSLADVAQIPHQGEKIGPLWHYFNHLLISPDGRRFIVLHRWRQAKARESQGGGGFRTRMITANLDGSGVYILDPSGYTSHFIWRDPKHICAWTRPAGKPAGFYLFHDRTREVLPVGHEKMPVNGHNTYLPHTDREWILNDTYPDRERRQTVYLYHVPSGRRVDLGRFHSPPEYRGEWRCDTHPRSSNDGRTIAIDSPHGGNGRQVHLIDVRQIVDG